MNLDNEKAAATQYLTFFVHGEEYAVEILRVREVMESLPVTRVPSAPPAIRGVVNVRGAVVPIVDLGVRFGAAELPVTRFTCVVIVELPLDGDSVAMGLLVDRVNQVIELDKSRIEPVPPFGVRVRIDFLRAMGNVGEKFVMLLDAERILSTTDLLATAAAAAETASVDAAAAAEGGAP
jgi:purine-binding chemotaxis protein CheW